MSFARAVTIRRAHGHAAQHATTAGFAALAARAEGDERSAYAYVREIASFPPERLRETEFPHIGAWASAAMAGGDARLEAYEAAGALYDERAALLGNDARRNRFAAVPWNAAFLRERDQISTFMT